MSPPVYLARSGAAAHLVLNRPDKRNALNDAMWRAIPGLLQEAEADPSVRVLIVRGEGGAFASGADIGELETLRDDPQQAQAHGRAISAALDALAAFPKPAIAAIEGACVGGGCALALACDLRFAAEGSTFAITPARLGLVYPFNDTRRLVDAAGAAAAKDLLFTGRMIGAEEALSLGLADRIYPAAALHDEAGAYARSLARVSAPSLRAAKAMIARLQDGVRDEDDSVRQLYLDAFRGADFREGVRAFLEKRAPDFPGD